MKMFKNALLLGGVMATFALTSCLKGGNSASYTAIGTVTTDKLGQTVFYADNAGATYRADNKDALANLDNRRITCKMDINYDNQTSNDYILTTISDVKKLTEHPYVPELSQPADTLGMCKDTLFVTPITSTATVCIQQKKYYINLNINYLAQKKDAGPEHEFTIYYDAAETNKPENSKNIYLLLTHNENGEIPGGKEMKTALETFDITTYVNDKDKKAEGNVYLTYYTSNGKKTLMLPFVNYEFSQL